jgi:fatty-acyl-CoA synthase/O-succinylbenzoic acid--CoA ligase
MTAELISFHARRRPQALAIVDADGSELSYAEVDRLLAGIAAQLTEDVPQLFQSALVALACDNRRWHLLLMLALEALGVAALPFVQPSDAEFVAAVNRCDLVLAQHPVPGSQVRTILLTEKWLAQVSARKDAAPLLSYRWPEQRTALVLLTSGSSGVGKCVPLDQPAIEARDNNRVWQYGLSDATRFLVALAVNVTGVLFTARGVLRCGGALIFWSPVRPLESFARCTHTILLPMHVRALLDLIPSDYQPAQRVKLYSLGARLGIALRDRAVGRLGVEMQNVYGSNEAGACLWIGSNEIGEVLPGVELEVVDDGGKPLPKGVPGVIRARAPEMSHAYLDAELTRERYRDGWFYTGDQGVLHGPRQVQLMGRIDALLNIGGVKIAPEEIEDLLQQDGLARDLAVCAMPDRDGIGELYIGIEGALLADEALMKRVGERLGLNFGSIHLVHVSAIPRSDRGKLQRVRLAEVIREQLANSPRGRSTTR